MECAGWVEQGLAGLHIGSRGIGQATHPRRPPEVMLSYRFAKFLRNVFAKLFDELAKSLAGEKWLPIWNQDINTSKPAGGI